MSSTRRPSTKVERSAHSASASRPLMNAARLNAWLPMSPMAPPPDCAGSVRQAACFCPVVLERRGQPVLRILGLDHPDPAELARRDPLARLAHHRKAGVVVGQPEHEAGAPHGLDQVERVVEVGGQRLVADHVDPGLEERLRGRMVDVVRGHDRDRVDAVVARGLALGHLREAAVGALGRDAQLGGRRFGPRRIGRQRARHQLVAVVEARRDPVHSTNERALAAAHHAEPQPPPEPALAPAFDRHLAPSLSRCRACGGWRPDRRSAR